jgi:hypothetical protein
MFVLSLEWLFEFKDLNKYLNQKLFLEFTYYSNKWRSNPRTLNPWSLASVYFREYRATINDRWGQIKNYFKTWSILIILKSKGLSLKLW